MLKIRLRYRADQASGRQCQNDCPVHIKFMPARSHQMTSDYNRSNLESRPTAMNNQVQKLVPKRLSLYSQTATSYKSLELLFHHHIAMLRTTMLHAVIQSPNAISCGIFARNIQDGHNSLVIHNDEWKSFNVNHQTALRRSVINELTSGEIVSLNFIESIKEACSRVQDLTSGEIVSLNLLSRTRKLVPVFKTSLRGRLLASIYESNKESSVTATMELRPFKCRKAYFLEDKQIPSVGVFDEVISTWMAFGGNTRDLGSFGEETDKITDLHQIHEEVLFTERGDGVAGIKRHCRDLSSDGVRDLATTSGRGRLKEDLESSM
ncbi:hypothetical protein Tco_1360849 [Tanacetum coccineum]